jgi:hypothetical protein
MIRILLAIGLTVATSCCAARGVGRIGEVTLIDRNTGFELAMYRYRGEYWVAGKPGARYSIEIHNRLGYRLLAVTSVDGVNVLSGETAAWNQSGYVLDGDERYQIAGWRKSDTDVAAFTFTSLPNSYASRTGRPANVGVIGVAVFREQPPTQAVAPREQLNEQPLGGIRDLPSPAAATPAPLQGHALADRDGASPDSEEVTVTGSRIMRSPRSEAPNPEAKLGTGHGQREYSYVIHTDFTRLQPVPNELIRIHYDSLENLMAMGIVQAAEQLLPHPNPFPGSPSRGYVPDPPR